MSDEIPPLPWTVELWGAEPECWGIRDANDRQVVITDCGHYPPNLATAQFIVDCVNKTAQPKRDRKAYMRGYMREYRANKSNNISK